MKQIASEKEARLTYLKRELAKSVTQSRYFKVKTSTYDPPARAIPKRVKRLIREIDALEKEMGLRAADEPRARVGSPKPRQISKAAMEQPKGGLNNTALTARQRITGCSANLTGGKNEA